MIAGDRKASRSPLRITLGCKSNSRAKSSIELQVPLESDLSQLWARTIAWTSNGLAARCEPFAPRSSISERPPLERAVKGT